jgi:methylthioribulose-1-phosphate dehydratase
VSRSLPAVARDLAAVGRRFYARDWVLGTSGNFSALISDDPFRLAITTSSIPKGALRPHHILQVDEHGTTLGRKAAKPSAETLLHIEIIRRCGAAAVLHTHSVWSTTLSDVHGAGGGLEIEGYEMLKGLHGVATHAHREWIPIVENDQDMTRLATRVGDTLDRNPAAHAFLLRRHGLYTWGESLSAAERHVEILEFLFEAVGRAPTVRTGEAHHGTTQNS